MSLVVVSNRLPISIARGRTGDWSVRPGSGGLVTALTPVLRSRVGTWIGWHGAAAEDAEGLDDLLARGVADAGFRLVPVALSREEVRGFYEGFSNEVIWPLFHDMTGHCNFEPDYWRVYRRVNDRFAQAAHARCAPDDFLWIHDYHLMLAARSLRALGFAGRLAFFLHIPFPPPDLYMKLPWRETLLESLLEFDLIGFQTARDRRNFLRCLRDLVPSLEITGRGALANVRVGGRNVRVGAFPIGIDFAEFDRGARSPAVEEKLAQLRADEGERAIVLGVDRLDYTKGLPRRIEAFERFLDGHGEAVGNVTYFQVVVPSRQEIGSYADLRQKIEQMVGRVNGRWTRSGWVPIHYIYRGLDRARLLAYYRAASVALVTPLKDGMNLVAKEYCAANVTLDGALVLSEFAGAAEQLARGARMVNPFDAEGVAAALAEALSWSAPERRARMARMRRNVREHDIFEWLDSFLRAAFARDLADFPQSGPSGSASEVEDELLTD